MSDAAGASLAQALRDRRCQGAGPLQLVARRPFWDEEALPFQVHGGGAVLRVVPAPGFARENLAGSPDERATIVDCPDDEGWLAASSIVAGWMARHVACPPLDDLLLAHPLYAHATKVDRRGRSRMGKARLASWVPGVPTIASIAEPPFTPADRAAPAVNRTRAAYAGAVVDLVGQLRDAFDLLEVEVPLRYAPTGRRRRRFLR